MRTTHALFVALIVALCACDRQPQKNYGFQFDVFCPHATSAAAVILDKSGSITKIIPGFWLNVTVPYGSGLFSVDGKHLPLTWPDCVVKMQATEWAR